MDTQFLTRSEKNKLYRKTLKDRKRIVVKVGSSSLLHPETGRMDYHKIDILARELSDLKNQGKEVILVSSGATAVGREALLSGSNFSFSELLKLGVIPIVNENDSVATYEYMVGDNDNLSAIVASLMEADLLILLSDVEGLFTDDPRRNPNAGFIEYVEKLDETMMGMGRETGRDHDGHGQGILRFQLRDRRHEHQAAGGLDRDQVRLRHGHCQRFGHESHP